MVITERTEEVRLGLEGEKFVILHLSDFHISWSSKKLELIKSKIFDSAPDLIVMTGDYFDTPRGASLFTIFLKEIAKVFKVVFVRGNHDFVYGRSIANKLLSIPNCFCVERDVLEHYTASGHLLRFTSWKNRTTLKEEKTAKNIVLIHNPENLKESELTGIDLILAGHLHGGQFIFWKSANNAFYPASFLYKYCTDRKQLDQTTLIVNKGLGDTLPLRYNCPHEIVKVVVD